MTCKEHHIICKAVGDGWICTACETRYMPMSELDQLEAQQQPKRLTDGMIETVVNLERRLYLRESCSGTEADIYARGVRSGLTQARDNGLCGGLSVEEVMEVVDSEVQHEPDRWRVRARLTAKLQGQ
jgi:hypothetical protein